MVESFGDTLAMQGIELTGHKFMAVDYGQNDYKKNVKGTLEKNVTFFNNDPIGVVMQMIKAREYNMHKGQFNDIMLVSIPKHELKQNKEGIIIEKNDTKYLNPSYIKGYARVDVENGNIENFKDNEAFIEKEDKSQTVEELSVDDWKEKFEGWYENSRTTKLQKIKAKIMGFFKSISNKQKQIGNQRDDEQFER